MPRYEEPGSWSYDKNRELEAELRHEDLFMAMGLEDEPLKLPEVQYYVCGCLVCQIDGWEKCKAMTYQQRQDRLDRFEDYAS